MTELAGHDLTTGRVDLGRSMTGGRRYGTTARCSCGEWPTTRGRKVSNEAPSAGGIITAKHLHAAHVQKAAAA